MHVWPGSGRRQALAATVLAAALGCRLRGFGHAMYGKCGAILQYGLIALAFYIVHPSEVNVGPGKIGWVGLCTGACLGRFGGCSKVVRCGGVRHEGMTVLRGQP